MTEGYWKQVRRNFYLLNKVPLLRDYGGTNLDCQSQVGYAAQQTSAARASSNKAEHLLRLANAEWVWCLRPWDNFIEDTRQSQGIRESLTLRRSSCRINFS